MKKAKLILLAIATFTIAGGALAFKVHKNLKVAYYYCNSSNKCKTTIVIGTSLASIEPATNTVVIPLGTFIANGKLDVSCSDASNPCTATLYYASTMNN